MKLNKNIFYYLAAAAVFIVLKFCYTFADNTGLIFLLKPTDRVISLVTGSGSDFIVESGYFHRELNIVIDKSCSGFNFWIMCFLMLSFVLGSYLKNLTQKILALPSLLLAAYFLTVFVNSSRILFSVSVHRLGIFPSASQSDWMHQAEGVFIYLSFLMAIYLAFSSLLKSKEAKVKSRFSLN